MSFGGFCRTPLWQPNVTWHTDYPRLTPCFENTVLTWIPFTTLLIFLPIKMASSIGPKVPPYPMTLLSYAKYAFMFYLCLLRVLCLNDYVGPDVSESEFMACVIRLAGCVISIMYQYAEQRRGRQTSNVLFVYWTLSACCSTASYYRVLRNTFSTRSEALPSAFTYTLNVIAYPVMWCLVVLYSFTEHHPKDKVTVCPMDVASPISTISFEWFTSLILSGYWKTLKVDDLFPVSEEIKTVNNYKNWLRKNNNVIDGRHLKWSLFRTVWGMVLSTLVIQILFAFFRTMPPVLLTFMIHFVIVKEEEYWKGFFYALSIFLAGKTGMTLLRHCDFHYVVMGIQLKGILVHAVYTKTLRVASACLTKYTAGEIINLMTVDADKIYQTSLFVTAGMGALLMTLMAAAWLWLFIGPSSLTIIVVTIVILPITALLARVADRLQQKLMSLKDNRLMFTNEALSNIRILKFYTWEMPFLNRILSIRNQEVLTIKFYAVLAATMRFFWFTLPFVQSLAIFTVYMLTEGLTTLDVQTGFVCITLCSMLRMNLATCPDVISNFIQSSVALGRIAEFLDAEEKDTDIIGSDPGEGNAIRFSNASFTWSAHSDEPPFLQDIDLTIPKGQIVGVFGLVGSGKSSFLNAMLGEMELVEGRLDIDGDVAYVPQRAWILHGTIRKNITFMNEYEKYFYKRVTDKCCLRSDFDMLMDGDKTEIGEKGVNLSGGQRQRVSLARAVYLDKDIYLLDDPLSAVDAQVCSKIFNKVIGSRGILQNKTRIFVTNNLALLQAVDVVLFLQGGRIADYGPYRDLISRGGEFARVVREFSRQRDDDDKRDTGGAMMAKVMSSIADSVDISNTMSAITRANALVCEEGVQVGSINKQVYFNYLRHVGCLIVMLTFTGYVGCRVFDVGCGLWIGSWSQDSNLPKEQQTEERRNHRMVIYAVLGTMMGLFAFLGTSMLSYGTIKASRTLHENMMVCMFDAPMSFFDTTPVGRILNRVGKDIDQLDVQLPLMANVFFELFFQLMAMGVLISIVMPQFLIVAVPLGCLYVFMQKFYLRTLRQLKRLEGVTRSPVVNTFGETLDGLSSIRSYNAEQVFIDRFLAEVDTTQNCSFSLLISKLWMISRLDLIGCSLVLTTAFLIIYWRDTISPGTAGLLMSYIITSTYAFNNLVHFAAESEAAIVSSERVEEYSKVEGEAARYIEPAPPEDWPQKGVISFINYSARYREGLRMCLRDLNIEFDAAEKVAIVGRTGAGKSTLTLALFRMIEAAKGCIVIDDIDISKIGLHDLRSKITIIPQEAVLFSGTLRMNLDPEDDHDDRELWEVLDITHLRDRFPDGLETVINEGGSNISVGQRQLVCLCRAVLKHSRILILDEATAAVDVETDALIQRTIRELFRESTVITIAHRLNTILDSDRIVVMADGEVIEMGPPNDLLADSSTEFYSMAREAGLL
ncbi:hypothetical protein HPB49_000667 [Dermacentor silvarum]|uniref:Uncharacterized protein n=1 Tax=Dermacentor silvarum TaxID=543639 RepID=A0ACB8DLZ6_DERSI|nr:multidrug resistance-associated protein 1 [Dermacentor silvarum]KAH7973399.1 hypothetical protein HPB49_000667 [Dermacentor silvarum]